MERVLSLEICIGICIALILYTFIHCGYKEILFKKKTTYLESIGFVREERKHIWCSDYYYVRNKNKYEKLSEDDIYNTRLKKLKELYN